MMHRLRQRSALLILVLAFASSCAKEKPRGVPVLPAWPAAYTAAVADALDPQPNEIATDLVAIVRDNPALVWKTFPDGDRVLMVSLVGDTSFYPSAPEAAYDTGTHDTWLTAVPEIRRACSRPDFGKGDLAGRLRQVFGLVPNERVTAFVEFWVLPAQLFRPAADNEITDTTAGLTMPSTTEAWYRTWFNQLRAKQYFQSASPANDAYPWTQLGYTYDWGSDRHQGFSEFVIKRHSTVFVNSITPYAASR